MRSSKTCCREDEIRISHDNLTNSMAIEQDCDINRHLVTLL